MYIIFYVNISVKAKTMLRLIQEKSLPFKGDIRLDTRFILGGERFVMGSRCIATKNSKVLGDVLAVSLAGDPNLEAESDEDTDDAEHDCTVLDVSSVIKRLQVTGEQAGVFFLFLGRVTHSCNVYDLRNFNHDAFLSFAKLSHHYRVIDFLNSTVQWIKSNDRFSVAEIIQILQFCVGKNDRYASEVVLCVIAKITDLQSLLKVVSFALGEYFYEYFEVCFVDRYKMLKEGCDYTS